MTKPQLDNEPGRRWRSLADTADAAQRLYFAPQEWQSYRRGTDFYDEMALIWLEADTIIRKQTGGARSLDDFCRRFHGGAPSGMPALKTYTLADVMTDLNAVAPYDWRGFFEARVDAVTPHAPLGGLASAGWKLVYTSKEGDAQKADESRWHFLDLTASLGITLGDDGRVNDLLPGTPGARAGLAPGMKITAVGGHRYSAEGLRSAVAASNTVAYPLELIVENGDEISVYRVDYHGGARYPHLERDNSLAATGAPQPDLIAQIVRPLASLPTAAPAKP